MKTETVNMPPLSFRADIGAIDEEARTFDVIFSTGAPVVRMDWWSGKRYLEVLAIKPENVRLERLNSGAPLLDAHSAWSVGDVLGTIEPDSARIEKGKAVAKIRFSKREAVEPIFQDVRDKIIRSVSVGYRVHKFEEKTGKSNELPIRTATDWEPFEISMVPMPADTGARVRQGDTSDTNTCVITRGLEGTMDEETKVQETPPAEASKETPKEEPPVNIEATRAAAATAERERVLGIQNAVRLGGDRLPNGMAADMIGRNLTLDQARKEIFDVLARASDRELPPNAGRLEVGADERDKWLRGAMNWLLVKSGAATLVARAEKAELASFAPGEFRGWTLLDLAKMSIERAGQSTRGLDKMSLVAKAFTVRNAQTTSDFTVLLENTMHKVLQAAYALAPDTWRLWCKEGTVTDFRAHNRYRTGHFSVLDDLNEAGEFKHKAIPDGEKGSITVTTKGNIVAITRQLIVNDDMGVLNDLLSKLGRASQLSIETSAYALLAQNAGLGPNQTDGQPLFAAARVNIGVGAAITMAAIDADAAVMAAQRDPAGQEYLDLVPFTLMVPRALRATALSINQSQYDPDTLSGKSQFKPNICMGMFKNVVATPRITGTRRYLFADPAVAPVFEVAFLEGQTAPVLESRDGWTTDGSEMRVRFDYGVAAIDHRGAVTNAGA